MDKKQGTVKFFNTEKGFGFIKHDDSNQETFVHASGLIDQIKEGDKVEFDVQNGKKGLNAVNVKLVWYIWSFCTQLFGRNYIAAFFMYLFQHATFR